MRTDTKKIELCKKCNCMTHTFMDEDGIRYCGKCKEFKPELRTCPACKEEVEVIHLEDPMVWDGWIEYICPKCDARVGRWSGKLMKNHQRENPRLRYRKEGR